MTKSTTPTKWGIVSTGKMANDFAQVVRTLPQSDHKLIAVAEWQLDQAEKFAATHEIPKSYGDFKDLAKNPDIEIVYIAIVNPYHYSLAKLMLNNGKHVLVEKPMTLSVKQTEELVNLARAKNLFLMEGIWPRFLPSYQFVRKQISEGTIGEVFHINANCGSILDHVDRIVKKELGGGVIVDMGVYCIDIVAQVYGAEEPKEIKCIGDLNDNGVDIHCSAALKFSGNKSATITSHSCVELPREAHLCGTRGSIIIKSIATSDHGTFRVYVNGELHEFKSKISHICVNFEGSLGLHHEINAVRKCLLEGRIESPDVTHKDSIYLAKIEEELRKQLNVVYDYDIQI